MSKPGDEEPKITPVRNATDLADTIKLFYAYAESLGIDLSFQGFDAEMAGMPGKYAPPQGELLLARNSKDEAIGCVGLRPLPHTDNKVAEMKRLYVAPDGRGTGVGKALASQLISTAASLGYDEVRLDTLSSMVAAIKMYRALGFEDIPAYYDTPLQETHFLRLRIPRQSTSPQTAHTNVPSTIS
jgi:ribosomal protein S18 acetylase RimI-like enzyme